MVRTVPAADVEGLFRAVRSACSPRSWSRGVELLRGRGVVAARAGAEGDPGREVVVRVHAPGRPVASTVTLYPQDEEWDCDCGSDEDACEHVAAATIALRRALEQGASLPAQRVAAPQLGYRLERDGERLALQRVLVAADGGEELFDGSLGSVVAARAERSGYAGLAPTHADLAIDRILTARRLRSLPLDTILSLLPLLAEAADVQLEGRPVAIDTTPVLPRAIVSDAGRGYRLTIESDRSVEAVVIGGLVLCRSASASAAPGPDEAERPERSGEPGSGAGGSERLVLRPLGAIALTGARLEHLPSQRDFGPHGVAELVTEILPSLARSIGVDIQSRALPRGTCRLDARCIIEVVQSGETLSLFPLLVYGDPPCARVDGDRLEHLGGPIVERDREAERRAAARLLAELDLVPGRRTHVTGLDAYETAARLRRWSGEVRGSAHRERYAVDPLRPEIETSGGTFGLRFVASACTGEGCGGEQALEAAAEAVLEAWREGAGLVALDGGGYAPLPVEWLAEHGDRVADLLAARQANGELVPAAGPSLLELCDALDHPRPAELGDLQPLLEDFRGIPSAALPADLQATLRPYQRRGVDWLCFLRDAGLGALLADDMGLGKTLQAMCAFRDRVLVVCPTSVVHNWADELRRFRPEVRFATYTGPSRSLDATVEVTLTSYAILRLDVEVLAAVPWDVVVLDEAQAIKNPESQVAQAAFRLQGHFRTVLSGTPVENRLEELWSLSHFANPGLLGGREAFRQRYARPIADGIPGAAARLRQRIRPFVLRRTKAEVTPELPPRIEAVLHCELEPAEREVYDAVRLATRADVVARLQAGGSVLAALEALLRLRQAACHTGLVPGQHAQTSAKITRLCEALDELVAGGHKALVFSQWTSLLDRVEPHLEAAALGYTRLDGSTRDREGVVASFQSADGPPILLLSLKAGGTGLNLTAADHVFLLDPWWNPAVEEQAADRAHRIGQDRPVMIYRLVAKDTVEERILSLQQRKRALAEAALGDAAQAAGLTREDLLALLE